MGEDVLDSCNYVYLKNIILPSNKWLQKSKTYVSSECEKRWIRFLYLYVHTSSPLKQMATKMAYEVFPSNYGLASVISIPEKVMLRECMHRCIALTVK
jgi:hypothetical protein